MKKLFLLVSLAGLGWPTTNLLIAADPDRLATETAPVITSIRVEGTNAVVVVSVPANIAKVTLEGCRRVGGGAWTPKAVGRLNGTGGMLTFRLALAPDLELLRVRADAGEALPDFFYRGPSSFDGQPVGSVSGGPPAAGGAITTSAGVLFYTSNGNSSIASLDSQPGPARIVSESDIWKISGNTLYFFNQYRGLQVIDISQPDSPVVRGTLPIAAAGEQMYLLDDSHVLLLTRDRCNWGANADSQALVVEINEGKPANAISLPIKGTITESRLVGTALYVASTTYRELVSTNPVDAGQWEQGTQVSSFDLSHPNQPVARST